MSEASVNEHQRDIPIWERSDSFCPAPDLFAQSYRSIACADPGPALAREMYAGQNLFCSVHDLLLQLHSVSSGQLLNCLSSLYPGGFKVLLSILETSLILPFGITDNSLR